jgi:histidyl-tRNA synthetase
MIQAPKGTHDIYGGDMRLWRRVEDEIRSLTDIYGYGEIRTPLFEATDLYQRGVGNTTDIVQKEMYTFNDKAGRSLSLRPELTAGAARAYVERGMFNQPQPVKLFYIGPNFRYENPQAGRYRQHTQFGIEIFGSYTAAADVEVITLGHTLITRLGLTGITLFINSIGCPVCRGVYREHLTEYLNERFENLCGTCKQRFERNPLRILDCKVPYCRELLKDAPVVLDTLDDDCRAHFTDVKRMLSTMGIPYVVDGKIVRGLDYYTRTVFEFIGQGLTVIGGGRYDGLIEAVGGAPAGGAGFGMGMERLAQHLQKQQPSEKNARGIFIGGIGDEGQSHALKLVHDLRQAGIYAESDLLSRSVKAQMKYADKLNTRFSCVLGSDELAKGAVSVKDMQTGEKHTVSVLDINSWVGLCKTM